MTEHVIEIVSENYLLNNEVVDLSRIPEDAEYTCYKLNSHGEAEYYEMRKGGNTHRIMSPCDNEDYMARARAVLSHAKADGMKLSGSFEISIIIDPEQFDMAGMIVGETEVCMAMTRYKASVYSFEGVEHEIESDGFVIEVTATQPMPLVLKRLYYNDGRELMNIEYVMYSINSDRLLDTRFSFFETSSVAEPLIRELYVEPYIDEEDQFEGHYLLPVVDQAYLDEVAEYLNFELVAHVDLQGNVINDEEMQDADLMYERKFVRQWFNADQQLKINQFFTLQGIGHTDIFDVPQDKHLQTLHAYLRKIHSNLELISLDHENATYHVKMHEPMSENSTRAVPLAARQYKRHASIYYTLEIEYVELVACECLVFDENNRAIKKLIFARPGEQKLMFEEVFRYDEQGNPLESEMIQHA